MKKAVLLCFSILALSAIGFSTPLPSACSSGTVSAYEALGVTGCSVGNLVFSDFMFAASQTGGAPLPTAAGITVSPMSSTNNAGFLFGTTAVSTTAGQSVSAAITFVVTAGSGVSITDSALSVTAAAGAGQTAMALVTECLGGTLPACSGGTSTGLMANPGSLTDSNTFAGVTTVGVQSTLSASNGGTVASDLLQFSTSPVGGTTPEPASLLLFGTGALGLGLLARRSKWLSRRKAGNAQHHNL